MAERARTCDVLPDYLIPLIVDGSLPPPHAISPNTPSFAAKPSSSGLAAPAGLTGSEREGGDHGVALAREGGMKEKERGERQRRSREGKNLGIHRCHELLEGGRNEASSSASEERRLVQARKCKGERHSSEAERLARQRGEKRGNPRKKGGFHR
jgi:hypothetical protein